jgi:hypothetical protein
MIDVNPTSFIKVLRDNFTGSMEKFVLEPESDIMNGSHVWLICDSLKNST